MKRLLHLLSLIASLAWLAASCAAADSARASDAPVVERWGVFEIELPGPTEGNPFLDVRLSAVFTDGSRTIEVDGFYDGGGTYRIRFAPEEVGEWRYRTASNRPELTGRAGSFVVGPPRSGNHGPVHVHNTHHFAYADGTPFHQIGTTCYTWTHRSEALQEQTLQTLARSPFNKLRMCVFPQSFGIKHMPPTRFPFEGTPPKTWDFSRFNPEFFRHLEMRIGQLRDLGIECDLILFHPYDGRVWGFDEMDAASDDRYLRYVVARLAAFRNIWWSLANEYDGLATKTEADWDRFFQIIQGSDPSGHLRSIHNGERFYNHAQPWVTHVSVQCGPATTDPMSARLFRLLYRKPIVFDEVEYEGDFSQRWGDLSAVELVHRFWCGTVAGTYVGHSEFFTDPNDVVWLGPGGTLKGGSPVRLAFLRRILEDGPAEIDPIDRWAEEGSVGGKAGEYYLVYLGRAAPAVWPFELPETGLADGIKFRVEIIDTWLMTITPFDAVFTLKRKNAYAFIDADAGAVALSGKPGLALRVRRVDTESSAVPHP
jgi:hypothetical protein